MSGGGETSTPRLADPDPGTEQRLVSGAKLERSGRGTDLDAGEQPTVSVIVPVTERPQRLTELYREFADPLLGTFPECEFVFVAPVWRQELLRPLRALQEEGEPLQLLVIGGEESEGALLKAAARRARGDVLVTLPAYRRIEPAGVVALVEEVLEGADLTVARRWPREDSWVNRLQTRVFHVLLRWLAGASVSDTGSGVRAMRREVLERVPLYGDFYRFLPVLARRDGYRVEEVATPQHKRDAETRLYGPGVYLRRLIDLLGLFFLTRFTYKPLRFFGLIGSVLGGAGAVVLLVVFFQRLGGQPLADRPMLVLGVLLATLGVQAVALGLVGEIIVHFNAPERPAYRLRSETSDSEVGP